MRHCRTRTLRAADSSRGFTLVELLVVITIIAVLIALLLPSVQMAREAARRTHCTNNLKQLALGCLDHEHAVGRFPTDGWGWGWTGDAERGNDWRQPAGWIYNILPYIELQALHDMGLGQSGSAKYAEHAKRQSVPISALYCPSRRPPIVYQNSFKEDVVNAAPTPSLLAVNDYVGNGGDTYSAPGTNYAAIYGGTSPWAEYGPTSEAAVESLPHCMTTNARKVFSAENRTSTGVFCTGSMMTMADVTDGTSYTFLLGEKNVDPDRYENGTDYGDNNSMGGDNADIIRWTLAVPVPDTPGSLCCYYFGAAHLSGCHMAFCDGTVHSISYNIDLTTFKLLGNRKDGTPIDMSKVR